MSYYADIRYCRRHHACEYTYNGVLPFFGMKSPRCTPSSHAASQSTNTKMQPMAPYRENNPLPGLSATDDTYQWGVYAVMMARQTTSADPQHTSRWGKTVTPFVAGSDPGRLLHPGGVRLCGVNTWPVSECNRYWLQVVWEQANVATGRKVLQCYSRTGDITCIFFQSWYV